MKKRTDEKAQLFLQNILKQTVFENLVKIVPDTGT